MLNKKIASEVAVGIVLLIAIVIGGIFWLQSKKISKQINQVPVQTSSKQTDQEGLSQTRYKIINIENSKVKLSFEIPRNWGLETRNSMQMTDVQMRNFLMSGSKDSDSQSFGLYTLDYNRGEIEKLNHNQLVNYFNKRNFPLASVSSTQVAYIENNAYQIDFNIGNFDIANAVDKVDCSGKCVTQKTVAIKADKGDATSIENVDKRDAKCSNENMVVSGLNATVFTYDHDILDDKPYSSVASENGCSGGREYYISLDPKNKLVLTILQPFNAPDAQFEKDFQHLMDTLQIKAQ